MLKSKTAGVLEDIPKEYLCNHHVMIFFLTRTIKIEKIPIKTIKLERKKRHTLFHEI